MKAILCLLAVVCAVNAKSYLQGASEGLLDFGQQVVDKLTEAGIDVEALTAALGQAVQTGIENGKSIAEIEAMAVSYLQDGCQKGFVVEGNLDLQNALNAFRAQGCPVLAKLQAEAMAMMDAAGEMAGTLGDAMAGDEE